MKKSLIELCVNFAIRVGGVAIALLVIWLVIVYGTQVLDFFVNQLSNIDKVPEMTFWAFCRTAAVFVASIVFTVYGSILIIGSMLFGTASLISE